MKNSEDVHLEINKNRLRIVGIGYALAALVVFMICFMLAADLEGAWSIVLKVVGSLVGIFFIVTGASALQKLGDKNAGIWFDSEGVLDNATTISVGLIHWKSITSVEVIAKDKLILVFVKRPEEIIKKAKNSAIKQLLQRNLALYKTPIIIESKHLNCSFEKLSEVVIAHNKKYGSKK